MQHLPLAKKVTLFSVIIALTATAALPLALLEVGPSWLPAVPGLIAAALAVIGAQRFKHQILPHLETLHQRLGDPNSAKEPVTGQHLQYLPNALDHLTANRAAEKEALSVVRNISEGLIVVSPDGQIRSVNRSIREMLGYTEAELIGRAFTDVYVKFRSVKRQGFFKRRETAREEELFKSKDGKVIPVRFSSSFLFDDDMEVLGFVCIAKDITMEKQAEEEMQKQSEWFLGTLSSIGDAVITTDTSGAITFINHMAEELTGFSGEEAAEKPISRVYRLLDETTREVVTLPLGEDEDTNRAWGRSDMILKRKDGVEIVVDNSVAPIIDGNDERLGVVVVFRDISLQRRAAQELERAKEKAEDAVRAKGQFLANMSHEIRTPMNGVIGMTGLLLDTELTKEQRESAEIVRSCGEALLSLINDILDFSKIEAGKLELEIIEFEPRTSVEEVGDLLAQKAQEKGLEMVIRVDNAIPAKLEGDPGRLRQVLLNLVNNAIKFTKVGEILIKVSLAADDEDTVLLFFEVIDTGIGIPEEGVKQLFKPFSQVDASTTRKYGGTGLGLVICKQLAEAMGGETGLTSVFGEGSNFYFTARFRKAAAEAGGPIMPPRILAGLKILVIDDNRTNRVILREQLTHAGCEVVEAEDGEAGSRLLIQELDTPKPFNLAILDFGLLEFDEEQMAARINADERLKKCGFLLLTSIPRRGDAAKMQKIGIDGYLTKPVKLQQLYDSIATIMGYYRKGTPSHPTHKKLVTKHTLKEMEKNRFKILVAEDNMVNQKVTARLLNKAGYYCDLTANGLETLEALSRIAYDLVLMDCQMPEMDGFEATREIRRREGEDKHTPVIALTANALKGDRERCLAAGMDDYLSKPIKKQQLYDVLEKFLDPEKEKAAEGDSYSTP